MANGALCVCVCVLRSCVNQFNLEFYSGRQINFIYNLHIVYALSLSVCVFVLSSRALVAHSYLHFCRCLIVDNAKYISIVFEWPLVLVLFAAQIHFIYFIQWSCSLCCCDYSLRCPIELFNWMFAVAPLRRRRHLQRCAKPTSIAYLHFGTSVAIFRPFILLFHFSSIIELGASVTLEWHSNARRDTYVCFILPIAYPSHTELHFVQRNFPYFNLLLTCNETKKKNKWIITDVCISSNKFYRIEGDIEMGTRDTPLLKAEKEG